MNPEGNNPLENPVALGGGNPNDTNPMSAGGLSMADGLASAEDNLTAAGMAATTGSGVMDLGQISASDPEAIMTPPIEEPLIPAAPVPGSIGSVTSVPPVNTAEAANPPLNMTEANGTSLVGNEPTAPFNPFAQPIAPQGETIPTATAGPAMGPVPTPAQAPLPNPDPAAAFQPPVPPMSAKKGKLNVLTILFAVLFVLATVAAIVFAVLYVNETKNTKVVYVPSVSTEESNAKIEELTCVGTADASIYAGVDYAVEGVQTVTSTYSNGSLEAIDFTYRMPFGDMQLSLAAQSGFATLNEETINAVAGSISTAYEGDDNGTLTVTMSSGDNTLNQNDAVQLIYGPGVFDEAVDMQTVRGLYEMNGFTCSVN